MDGKRQKLISRDPEILSGEPVFAGTRVPVRMFFSYLEIGSAEEFVDEFPTVTREQAVQVLSLANASLMTEVG